MEAPKVEGLNLPLPERVDSAGILVVRSHDDTVDALADMRARKDSAYEERTHCVALMARMAVAMGLPVTVTTIGIEGWASKWRTCVYIELPTGQVSWHVQEQLVHLFDGLPVRNDVPVWDGHSTGEKYRRVDSAFPLITA